MYFPPPSTRPARFTLGVAALILATACAPAADFGDAPDSAPTGYPAGFPQNGQFPTLAASGGASADDTAQATLGPTASEENDANDPNDPDGQPNLNPSNTDSDDGVVDFVIILTSIPPTAQMAVNVNGPAGSVGGQFWLNVLIDMNMNGLWDGVIAPNVNEWAVINFPVTVSPGVSNDVALPPFLFGNGNRLPDGAWMRIALTDSQIAASWTGGGTFAAGEIEDHVIDLPVIGDPPKTCMPAMSCPDRVTLPRNGAPRQFTCTIRNAAPGNCTASYTLESLNNPGSVAVTRVPPGFPAPDACAPNGPDPVVCNGPIASITPGRALTFSARKTGPLPATWQYTAAALDPPSVVIDGGIIAGFGDSVGTVEFEDEPVEEKEQKRPRK